MANWDSTKIDVGTVDEMTSINFQFRGLPDMKKVKRVVPGCVHCTTVKFDEKERKLTGTLSLGQTPIHLRVNKINAFDKRIAVQYVDGTVENLFVSGKKKTN